MPKNRGAVPSPCRRAFVSCHNIGRVTEQLHLCKISLELDLIVKPPPMPDMFVIIPGAFRSALMGGLQDGVQ
ncbi:hypothetical protein L1987_37813 [Smallanthus sonchifolius]|uniref:Uncharacterized protein n=1 Tax=Smallanthus sonchifolius TaxID=185202 RepID=A0ACB9HH72_9ASTR|nr:hypothetical protein L1987_37813 [Smallanthus sonchifolius]